MIKKKLLRGNLIVKTGLHIGGGNEEIKIGGLDNEVIKEPISELPYIPGSSLKGKIRSLLETETEYEQKLIDTIFGFLSQRQSDDEKVMTKVLFRDAQLSKDWKDRYRRGEVENESKAEVKIDRATGSVGESGPRVIERVPVGVKFEFSLILRTDEDDMSIKKIEEIVKEGFELLERDYLGGSGSRGYGAVKINFVDDDESHE